MSSAAIVRALSTIGTSYRSASVLGFLAAGMSFPFAAGLTPTEDHRQMLLLFVIIGPLAGCVVTFIARRSVDLALRLSPNLGSELVAGFEGDGRKFEFTAAFAASAIVAVGVLVAFVAISDVRHATPMQKKCILANTC